MDYTKNKRYVIWGITLFLIFVFTVLLFNQGLKYQIKEIRDTSNHTYWNYIILDSEQVAAGENLRLDNSNRVKIFLDKPHQMSLAEIREKSVIIIFDDYKYEIQNSGTQNINMDSDEFYDISFTLRKLNTDSAEIYVKSTNEKVSAIDTVTSKMKGLTTNIERTQNIQIFLMILVLFLIFILTGYYIKTHLIPEMNLKRKLVRETPESVMDYLISECKKNMKKNDKESVKKIFSRIKHLYGYMSEDEKKPFTKKIEEIENYIK
jgi:hypothetical protein